MPPVKGIQALQDIAFNVLAGTMSNSISSLVSGKYADHKQKMAKKSGRESTKVKKPAKTVAVRKKQPYLIMVVPQKEAQRMKNYLDDFMPKAWRTKFFHEVLRLTTEQILNFTEHGPKPKYKNEANAKTKIGYLEDGVMNAFKINMSNDITDIDFTRIFHLTMKWIDTCRLSHSDPKTDILNYSKIETILLKNFAENAKYMTNVTSLKWPHLISGNLIRIVSHHLQRLQYLTLACSCETGPFIEEERKDNEETGQKELINSLASLFERAPGDFTSSDNFGCPKLKQLILPNLEDEDRKAARIIAKALNLLKELEVVSGVSTILSVMLLKQSDNCPKQLSLITLNDYDPFKQRAMPDVDTLKILLPKIRNIELRVSEDINEKIIQKFPNITDLSIETSKFHTKLKNFSTLICLNISLDFNSPWSLILGLSKYCKQMKYLTLEHSSFKIDPEYLEELKIPRMLHLTHLKLIRSSFIEAIALETLVRGCANLIELNFTLSNDRNYVVDELSDELVSSIAPLMNNLKRFSAECLYKYNLYLHPNCILTIQSIKSLISHCPKLQYIGYLDSWEVTDKDIDMLSTKIKTKNWDLEIG